MDENTAKHVRRLYVFLGFFCAIACVGLGIFAFVYDDWMYYEVNETTQCATSSNITCFSRRRGIFFECIANKTLEVANTNNDKCIPVLLGFTSSKFECIHIVLLRRSHLGLHAASFICAAVSLLIGLGGLIQMCLSRKVKEIFRPIRILCGILFILAAISYLVSLIVFHILHDYEKMSTCTDIPFIYARWDDAVKMATEVYFSYMYGVAWGACGMAIAAAIIFLTMGMCCTPKKTSQPSKDDQAYLFNSDTLYMAPVGQTEQPKPIANNNDMPINSTNSLRVTPVVGPTEDRQSQQSAPSARRLPRYQADAGQDNPYFYGGGADKSTPPTQRSSKNLYRIY